MSPEEKYLYDLRGYLVLEQALAPKLVDRLNQTVDELESLGVRVNGNLFISEKAHVVMPYHRELEACSEKRKGSESSRTNRKAFTDGGSGVAHGIEAVGAGAYFLGQFAHLGDTAGIVGDRPVGIHRQLNARVGQHAHCGNRDAVQACKVICTEDGRGEK